MWFLLLPLLLMMMMMMMLSLVLLLLLLPWSHPRRRPTPTQVALPCAMLVALLLYHFGAYPPAFVNTVDCVFLLLRVVSEHVCVSARACVHGGACAAKHLSIHETE